MSIKTFLFGAARGFAESRDQLDRKAYRYAVCLVAVMILGAILGAWWGFGLGMLEENAKVQQWTSTRTLLEDTISHLRMFDGMTEAQRGVATILEYIGEINRTGDFNSVSRDLSAKVQILEMALSDMGLPEAAAALSRLGENLAQIDSSDWCDPQKQRGIMMLVYNDITATDQDTLDLSPRMRSLTLGSILQASRNTTLAFDHVKRGVSRLGDLRKSTAALWNLIAVDLLSGILQLEMASFLKDNIFQGWLPPREALLLAGLILVWTMGMSGVFVACLFDYTYAHYMSLREEMGTDAYGNPTEIHVGLDPMQFGMLLLTGRGLLYVPILLCLCLMMRSGRRGSGLALVVMSAIDACAGWLERYRRTEFLGYSTVVAMRLGLTSLPDTVLLLVVAFAMCNIVSIAILGCISPALALAHLSPVVQMLGTVRFWSSVGIIGAVHMGTWHLGRYAQTSFVTVANIAGGLGYMFDLGQLTYMLAGENYILSLVSWIYAGCLPARCMFYSVC